MSKVIHPYLVSTIHAMYMDVLELNEFYHHIGTSDTVTCFTEHSDMQI